MGGLAWEWFTSTPLAHSRTEDTGLEAFLFCADKFDNDITDSVGGAFLEFSRYNYEEVFNIHLHEKMPNGCAYFKFLTLLAK